MDQFDELKTIVNQNEAAIYEAGQSLWKHPETAYHEFFGAAMLARLYRSYGFTVEQGAGGFPTSFIAEWQQGEGKLIHIGLFSDFDALPGLSTTEKGAAGHGCMHNQYAARAFGTAISMKQYMEKHQIPGRLVVFGAPAEESGGSKQYFVRQGLFAGFDAFIGLHPVGHVNGVMFNRHLASSAHLYRFFGRTAHAALCPEKGLNALSALEFFNTGVHFLRGQLPDGIRINHVIKNGGVVSNMIPELCEAEYSLRAADLFTLEELVRRVDIIANAAAEALGCTVEIRDLGTLANSIPNHVLAQTAQANARLAGPAVYTEAEQQAAVNKGYPLGYLREITELPDAPQQIFGSTDEGDVSWLAPWVRISIPSSPKGVPAHTTDEVYFGGLRCGYKGTMQTVLTACMTIFDLLTQPEILKAAWEEHRQTLSGQQYRSAAEKYPDAKLFPSLPDSTLNGACLTLDRSKWQLFSDLRDTALRVVANGKVLGQTDLTDQQLIRIDLDRSETDARETLEIQFRGAKGWDTAGYVQIGGGEA